MSAKKLPRSGSRNRVVRAGGVLSIGGLSSDSSCGSVKKQLSMTRLELEGEEEGLKMSVDDVGTAAEVVYEEEIFEECLDDEEDAPAETVEDERIRRRLGSGRRSRGIPLPAKVGESINDDCSAQLTERGGADGLEADINDVSLVHPPAPPANDVRRAWAPEKKPASEDIVDKIVAEDGVVGRNVGGEPRSSSRCQENDGISGTDSPTAGRMVQDVSLGESVTLKYAILGGGGGGGGERRGGGFGREGRGGEGGSSGGGGSGGGSGGRGGGKAPSEKKVKGPVSGGPYGGSGKADGGSRGLGDRGSSKPAAGEKSGRKKTGENKENRGAGSSSSVLAPPAAEGKTDKKSVVKTEAAEAAVAHKARAVDSPAPRRSHVSGEASAQMSVCEEESIEGMPPKPKSTELRADVATFACRLGLGGRDTESLRGVDIGDKEAAAMVHGLRKNRDIQVLDLSDSSIRGEAAELLSSVLGSAAVPVPKLKSLIFARCPIGDSVAEVIFGCLARLEIASLDMRCTLLSPSAGQSLSKVIAASTACKLQNLNLSGNSLLSTGAAYIGSALSQCSTLAVLNLDGNGIDDSGAVNLANGIKANSSLHTLLVANNEIGNAGGMALVQCWQERQQRMRVIDISGNKLSGKVMGEVQKIGKNVVRVSK